MVEKFLDQNERQNLKQIVRLLFSATSAQ